MVFAQIKGLEGEMKPLKDGVQSLTSQKDALLAEKTALKNEASLAHQRNIIINKREKDARHYSNGELAILR